MLVKKMKQIAASLALFALSLAQVAYAVPVFLEILPQPVSVEIFPTNNTIGVDETLQYTAIATFPDTSTLDVTNHALVVWNSTNPGAADVGSDGLAVGLTPGSTQITASFGNQTSNIATLQVGEAPPAGGGSGGGGAPPEVLYLELVMHPEKRHDTSKRSAFSTSVNQDIQFQVRLLNPVTKQVAFVREAQTDDSGVARISADGIPAGTYDVEVKTISHLRRYLNSQALTFPTQVDVSQGKTILLKAGDVNGSYGDNFVNGLDFSTISNQIYSSDKKNDLNRDSIVNAIDFAITTGNIYQFGE
jgi:hypothetical protein